jgi:hypothetical protein
MNRLSGMCLAALLAGCATTHGKDAAATSSQPGEKLPFIEDDYPRALAVARAQNTPLFIEAWAPW